MPPVVIFSGGGDDALHSGAGPSPAINSTTEGTTASWVGTTVTFSGATDLTNVATDFTHVMLMVTTNCRKFFTIVGKATNQVTVAETPDAGAPTSGLSWAIGGDRQSMNNSQSRFLFNDWGAGWEVEIQNSQILSSGISCTGQLASLPTDQYPKLRGQSAAAPAAILLNANEPHFSFAGTGTGTWFQDLNLANGVGGSASDGFQVSQTNTNLFLKRVNISGSGNMFRGVHRVFGVLLLWMEDCTISGCTDHAIHNTPGSGSLQMRYCNIIDNANGVYHLPATALTLHGNLFCSSTAGYGLRIAGPIISDTGINNQRHILHNTFDGNAGNGLQLAPSPTNYDAKTILRYNIFSNNGAHGIGFDSAYGGTVHSDGMLEDNVFFNNTTAPTEAPLTTGVRPLTENPQYENAGGGNYQINNPAVRGIFRDVGSTRSYYDMGAAQIEETGGGPGPAGGLLRHPGMTGNINA